MVMSGGIIVSRHTNKRISTPYLSASATRPPHSRSAVKSRVNAQATEVYERLRRRRTRISFFLLASYGLGALVHSYLSTRRVQLLFFATIDGSLAKSDKRDDRAKMQAVALRMQRFRDTDAKKTRRRWRTLAHVIYHHSQSPNLPALSLLSIQR